MANSAQSLPKVPPDAPRVFFLCFLSHFQSNGRSFANLILSVGKAQQDEREKEKTWIIRPLSFPQDVWSCVLLLQTLYFWVCVDIFNCLKFKLKLPPLSSLRVIDAHLLVSPQCLPIHGHGFVLDKYKCHCKKGFYHHNRVAVNGFTGKSVITCFSDNRDNILFYWVPAGWFHLKGSQAT